MSNLLQYKDLNTQQDELIKILLNSEDIVAILNNAEKLNLKNWYLAAGAISQTVWNHLTNTKNEISDYDIVYFDEFDLNKEREKQLEDQMQKLLGGNKSYKVDITNQASVYLWYDKMTGIKINPYSCTEDGIASWITTITCVGITKRNGQYQVYAPYGLSELFGMIIKANKKQTTKEIYEAKCNKWKNKWPQLKIIEWNS